MQDAPSTKTIRILLKLLASPKRYRLKELGAFVGIIDRKAIDKHIRHIRAAGIDVAHDDHYRYYVLPQKGFKELNYLSPLSEIDKVQLKNALGYLPTAEALQLNNKLESLYDFQQLGLEALRRPELEKLNAAEEAMNGKLRAWLRGYRSRSSNNERDRKVEIFSVEPEYGMLRAYDTEKQRTSHFLLSRMSRIEVTDEPWMYASLHNISASDAFSIVDNDRVMVQMILRVSAYNALIEANPQARQYLRQGAEPNTYEFLGKINHRFIGLEQFVFANWPDVEILAPVALKEYLASKAKAMIKSLA